MNLIHKGFALSIVTAFSSQVLAQTSTDSSPGPRLNIGYVKFEGNACGCSLSLNIPDEVERRYVFVRDEGEPAYINLDGNNLKLEPVDSSERKVPEKVGDRSWETFVAGDVKARIDWTVRRVCDPKDEGCEVTYYRAILTVTRKTQKITVKTIGLCGC
jgi:hypothetical protein